jgi:HK97 family phage major capsid protein
MTIEEKAQHDALIETIKLEVSKASNAAELEALKSKLAEVEAKDSTPADYETIKNELAELATTVKAMNETPKKKSGYKSIKAAVKAAVMAKADEIEAIAKGGKQTSPIELTVKSVIDMGVDNTVGNNAVVVTQNTGIVSTIRKREMRYLAEVSVGSISTSRALWIEEQDEEGNPVFIGEGDGKTQLSVKYVEESLPVKKIAVYGKVTTELMADLPQLISYIQNNIMKRLDIATEDALFNGDGNGDNIKGLEEFATAFSAGDLSGAVTDANELDVIEAIALQVKTAYGEPKALFIHPSTMSVIKLIKDEAGRPVWKDYVTINGEMNVSGLKLVETTAVTAGDFIGGDTSVAQVLFRQEIGVLIGLDGNDFTQNKKTLLAEKRLVQFVSGNDEQVIVKGDFATAKAAILKS